MLYISDPEQEQMTVLRQRSGNTKRGRQRGKDIGIVRGERDHDKQRRGVRGVLSEDVLSVGSSDQPIRDQEDCSH